MVLEDFFKLAEIKDGLKSPNRVKELMNLMQTEKDRVLKNACDASTSVANIIAVTENKECLDLFVELDGLWFIKRWLKAAHKFGNESGIQDSTNALLRALEKLQIDKARLVSTGILTSVLELLVHDDSMIHEKAKALCDKWMQKQDDETNSSVAVSSSCSGDDDDEELAQESGDNMGTIKVGPGDASDKDGEVVYSSGGDNCKLGVQSEGDSGTGSRFSKPLIEGEGGGSTELASSESKAMRVSDGETTLGSVSEVAQESEANAERCLSGFDLNQEGGSEEIERPMDSVTTPISVVSASRRIAECGTSNNSKQRSDGLNIDLNVAEYSEDKNPIISCISSGKESPIEASPRRLLDLNSIGAGSVDNDVLNQNGGRSPSQSSSSSIMQPSMRNIDLNYNDNSSLQILELGLGRSSGGWAVGSSIGVYGHNGFPYMYFSSGGVSSEIVGLSLAQPPTPSQQPPDFLMNMAAGGSQENVDLNTGLMMNGGNRQVLNDNYHEGQSSWVVGGKRQEPDGGWDGFSGDYKHQQPPWK